MRASVGTVPAMLGKKLTTNYFQTRDWVEISCDIYSSAAAKAILGVSLGAAKKVIR